MIAYLFVIDKLHAGTKWAVGTQAPVFNKVQAAASMMF